MRTVIDSHMHLINTKCFDKPTYDRLGQSIPKDTNIDQLVAWMKAAGIEPTAKGTEGNPADAMQYGEFIDAVAPEAAVLASASPASAEAPAPVADSEAIVKIFNDAYEALCDDLNTPVALANVFEAVRIINSAKAGELKLSRNDLSTLLTLFDNVVFGVMGLRDESAAESGDKHVVDGLMDMVLDERAKAKAAKDWTTSDAIRDHLKALGITVKDTKDGSEWTIE